MSKLIVSVMLHGQLRYDIDTMSSVITTIRYDIEVQPSYDLDTTKIRIKTDRAGLRRKEGKLRCEIWQDHTPLGNNPSI